MFGDLDDSEQWIDHWEASSQERDAYGYLCSTVPIRLGLLQDMVIEGIDAATKSLDDAGDRLRAAARGYTGADDNSSAQVDNSYGPQ